MSAEKLSRCQHGCDFDGNEEQLRIHDDDNLQEHFRLLWEKLKNQSQNQAVVVAELRGKLASLSTEVRKSLVEVIMTEGHVQRAQSVLHARMDKLADLKRRLDNLQEKLNTFQTTLADQEQTVASLIRRQLLLASLDTSYMDGKVLWKIPNYRASRDAGQPLIGPKFYTGIPGHKMRIRAHLKDGADQLPTTFCIEMLRGNYDALLRRSFTYKIKLFVVDQKSKECAYPYKDSVPAWDTHENNPPLVLSTYCIPHQQLERESILVDDTLFVGLEVVKSE